MSRPRIVVVDDDRMMLELLRLVIGKDAEVHLFDSAKAALVALATLVPDLILSDIVMPDTGGFAFRQRYVELFGDRDTPFLFLSSLDDPDTMVAGLDGGADDYLVKPVEPVVLRARVRRAIRQHARMQPSFKGEFASTSFATVLEFCESKKFTGELIVDSLKLQLPIRGGSLDVEAAGPFVDQLFELQHGSFTLRAVGIDFGELSNGPSSQPAGRMSTVQVRGHKLMIATELVNDRDGATVRAPILVSTVMAEGQAVNKVSHPLFPSHDPNDVQRQIDALHHEVEASTLDRISALRHMKKHPDPEPPDTSSVAALFEQGLERSLEGDWLGAVVCWERASALDPHDRKLSINLEVARRKASRATA